MESTSFAGLSAIRVLVADSNQMECQLLVSALRQRPEFDVICCAADIDAILHGMMSFSPQIAVINTDHPRNESHDMTLVRRFHLAHPEISKIVLINSGDRDVVVNAFRSGARGLFCFAEYPFLLLCKCIQSVHQGQVWANSEQLQYLIEAVVQVPSLRVVNASGLKLLTPREEQVVALVADGLSNREIAQELGLSEHTVKKYLFRIFDKLGISSRVELVLYAFSHGGARQRSGWQEQALSAIRIHVVHSYFRLLHKTVRYNRVRLRNYALLAIPCIDPPRYFASLLQRLVGILGSDP